VNAFCFPLSFFSPLLGLSPFMYLSFAEDFFSLLMDIREAAPPVIYTLKNNQRQHSSPRPPFLSSGPPFTLFRPPPLKKRSFLFSPFVSPFAGTFTLKIIYPSRCLHSGVSKRILLLPFVLVVSLFPSSSFDQSESSIV